MTLWRKYREHRIMFYKRTILLLFVLFLCFMSGRCTGLYESRHEIKDAESQVMGAKNELKECREIWGDIKDPDITILVRPK